MKQNAISSKFIGSVPRKISRFAARPKLKFHQFLNFRNLLDRQVEAGLLMFLSHPTEGRLENVTDAGWDAVDAAVSRDERRLLRTAKSCGPDAPTLALRFAGLPARRRGQESPVPEESAKYAVKTIAQGRPDVSGVPVVANACAFLLHTRPWVHWAPGLPCAL
jgi:hypothetical protein